MEIETRKVYDVLVVDMAGRLDTQTSGDAGDRIVEIAQGGDKKVVVNLERLEYVSSAGLRVILRGAKLLQARRGELKICNAAGVVREVLEMKVSHMVKGLEDKAGGSAPMVPGRAKASAMRLHWRHQIRGEVLASRARFQEEAVRILRELANESDAPQRTLYYLGHAYVRTGDTEAAVETFNRFMETWEGDPRLLEEVGEIVKTLRP